MARTYVQNVHQFISLTHKTKHVLLAKVYMGLAAWNVVIAESALVALLGNSSRMANAQTAYLAAKDVQGKHAMNVTLVTQW